MNVFKKGSFTLLVVLLLLLTACGAEADNSNSTNTNEEKDPITIGQINWPENIAVTNMWKAILEEAGYDVELTLIEMGPQMASLAEGDLDIAPEIWLPVQDKSYYEAYKDSADFAKNPWYENGKVGLVVPEYMEDINSIEDLNENKDKFNGEITGFEPGAGTMKVTKEVINDYDLDFDLVSSSEAAMIASLKNAVKQKEPIVAPLWKPHYIFSELDLKFLDDPKKTYGEVEKIYMATRDGFASDYEEVHKWLKNWKLNDEQLGELMVYVKEHEDNPIEGAKKWVKENQDLVESWMK
ncbi:glycine betaine ABC transporter substrate-binding protein [Lentibacillus sp.]|uniref:glycine betaine ABC transporter substrate-binding protein n=1 Tax=Lentibacillus sp. TaxID=1925746 RepID=UPI002B4B3C96|nr:glycine betaine ABC transporter substrate-binding protein [Lentibacillus sp.]HLS09109.1 glycine betaine ABC transporter substrate-binding protein [Lentibacillus sp.]